MTRYNITRNGVIKQPYHGGHKCGNPDVLEYPYRVEITVSGTLQGPDYFIVANEAIAECVDQLFANAPTRSCKKMCDDICSTVLDLMKKHPQWVTERVYVELTGTNGLAELSCEWLREEQPEHATSLV